MTTTHAPTDRIELAAEADEGATRLETEVESIADECELVLRRVAELRADPAVSAPDRIAAPLALCRRL